MEGAQCQLRYLSIARMRGCEYEDLTQAASMGMTRRVLRQESVKHCAAALGVSLKEYHLIDAAARRALRKSKPRYRREHDSALILYEAAARALKDGGIKKLPDFAALKAEYDRLAGEKEKLAAEYGKAKKTLKEYGVIKQNVDSILRRTPEQERTQEL